jgi:PhnB protein
MATQISPYLTFNGNCEEAFNYYRSVFGGEFIHVMRLKDAPSAPGAPSLSEKDGNLVMNVALPINENTVLMGSDAHPMFGPVQFGKNVTMATEADTKEQADRLYTMLADGGKAHMPMADMFWGSYWGMVEDKFGFNWMVSYTKK